MASLARVCLLAFAALSARTAAEDLFGGENNTNDTEIDLFDEGTKVPTASPTASPTAAPTASPTASPTAASTPSPTMAGDIVFKTTSFTVVVELEDPEDFDLDQFLTAMAQSMGVATEDVEMDVKFKVNSVYKFAAEITEADARKAVAAASSVAESAVQVTITVNKARRLDGEAQGRQLATTSVVDSVITLDAADKEKAKAVLASASSAEGLADALSTVTGTTIPAPEIVTVPIMKVQAETKVKGTGDTAAKPPAASDFITKLETVTGTKYTAEIGEATFATEVSSPTASPTAAPTATPTAAPTDVGVEDAATRSSTVALLAALCAGATCFLALP